MREDKVVHPSREDMWTASFLSWSLLRWIVSSSRGGRGTEGAGVGPDGDGGVCCPLVDLDSSWEFDMDVCFGDRT